MQKYFSHYVLLVDSNARMIGFALKFWYNVNNNNQLFIAYIFSLLKTYIYTHTYRIAYL